MSMSTFIGRFSINLNLMSLQCDNLSGELQDQWSSSFFRFCRIFAIIVIKNDFVIHLRLLGPSGVLKTSGYALGFQHSPRDLANVNEWKIIFDPYIKI